MKCTKHNHTWHEMLQKAQENIAAYSNAQIVQEKYYPLVCPIDKSEVVIEDSDLKHLNQ